MAESKTKKTQKLFGGTFNFFRYIPTPYDLGMYQIHNRKSFADLGYPEESIKEGK